MLENSFYNLEELERLFITVTEEFAVNFLVIEKACNAPIAVVNSIERSYSLRRIDFGIP